MSAEESLKRFIVEELHFSGRPSELTDTFPLIETQTLDSMGIFEVVSYVESEFGVEIGDEELVPENFGTIGDIARLIKSKQVH